MIWGGADRQRWNPSRMAIPVVPVMVCGAHSEPAWPNLGNERRRHHAMMTYHCLDGLAVNVCIIMLFNPS
jgi:hypothetical protein